VKRYYFELDPLGIGCLVFDRKRSNTIPIAWTEDTSVADMIVAALNGDI